MRSKLRTVTATLVVATLPVVLGTVQAGAQTVDNPPGREAIVVAVDAPPPPDTSGLDVTGTIVGGTARDTTSGWFVTASGVVHAYGGASLFGGLGHLDLVEPIVAMASTRSGDGYWLVASDGGLFAFGDAGFFGSTGNIALNRPVVDISPTPSGNGYWMAADDGGVFAFGDAVFHGSMGAVPLNLPIVGISATESGNGYWLVARDGGVFAFGDAPFLGSTGAAPPTESVVDLVAQSNDDGYRIVTEAGGVIGFGTASAPSAASTVDGIVVAAAPVDEGLWLTRHITGPTVAVWQSGGLDAGVLGEVLAAAHDAGGTTSVNHTSTLRVLSFTRRGQTVDAAQPGWQIPMTARAVDPVAGATFMGGDVLGALTRGDVVLSRRTADRRGARPGDIVTFIGWDQTVQRRRVGAVVSDRHIASSELIFSINDATSFGFDRAGSVWVTGLRDAAGFSAELERIADGTRWLRWARSWDPPSTGPNDSVLSTASLKDRFGEFEFRYAAGDNIDMEPAWIAANIASHTFPIIGTITCNRAVFDDLTAALTQVEASDLAHLIDVADTRRHGGCWGPRRIRGTSGGAVSRHSWGLAIDINPRTNPWGTPPTMDLRIVDIFRANGFAWGGTWTRPDGMHFEWVGR